MMEVKLCFPLDDSVVGRIFHALGFRFDAKQAMVFGKYQDNEFMHNETAAGKITSEYISTKCSFRGKGVDSVIESLERNASKRNSLLSDLWEND